jgi:uncharacterized membrane protein YczE
MNHINALLDFIAVVIYSTIAVFAIIGGSLYANAYYLMKKTKIIGAVALLLFAIGIDTFWWMLTEFSRFISPEHVYHAWMVSPIALIITKSFLLITVIYFVVTSVREDKSAVKKCVEENLKKRSK